MGKPVKVVRHRRSAVLIGALARGTWRVVSGAELRGDPRSDATWWRSSTGAEVNGYRPTAWTRQPRAHRAFYRLLGIALVLAMALAWVIDPIAAQASAVGLFWLLVLYWGYGFYRWCGKYGHYSDKYVLMHRKIHQLVGWTRHKHPRDWLSIPRDYADNPDAAAVLVLPDELRLTDGLQRKIERNVGAVLDLPRASYSWSRGTRPMTLSVRTKPAPPARVTFAEMREAMANREPGTIILGKGDGGDPYVINPQGENPHVALSAQTGRGKSATASTMACQVLYDGANALVLDVKLISIPWARQLDSVRYCVTVAEIHAALIWLSGEIDRRFRAMRETVDIEGNVDASAVGPPLWVYLEEANTLIPELIEYYRSIRQTGMSQVSPAVTAIRRCMFMGRGADVHLVGIAQYLTAAAIGGPAARQNFATRILLGPDDRVWNLLVGREFKDKGRWPESLTHPGAAWVLNNGRLERCQITYTESREALAYVTEGNVTPFRPDFDAHVILDVPGRVPPGTPGTIIPFPGGTGTGGPDVITDGDDEDDAASNLVTLAEACRSGLVELSYEAARRRRTRERKRSEDTGTESTFPVARAMRGTEELYDRDELAAWFTTAGEGSA